MGSHGLEYFPGAFCVHGDDDESSGIGEEDLQQVPRDSQERDRARNLRKPTPQAASRLMMAAAL